MLAILKQILARVVIYLLPSLVFAFLSKGTIDFYILHSNQEDAIRLFIEKIPNGRLFFYVWGVTLLVVFIPGTIYEIYLRKNSIKK